MRTILLLASLVLAAPVVHAETAHKHGGKKTDKKAHDHTDSVQAEAKINAITDKMVNVTHGPIAEIGWPAMTMDLDILEGAKVGDVKTGDTVMMVLEKSEGGLYGIKALMPMK